MNIQVSKTDLIERLTKRRAQHLQVYTLAEKAYKKAVIKELENRLEAANEGNLEHATRYFRIEKPDNHSEAYDDAIAMVKTSEGDNVELNSNDFRQFYLDKWDWKSSFLHEAGALSVSFLGDEPGFAIDSDCLAYQASITAYEEEL